MVNISQFEWVDCLIEVFNIPDNTTQCQSKGNGFININNYLQITIRPELPAQHVWGGAHHKMGPRRRLPGVPFGIKPIIDAILAKFSGAFRVKQVTGYRQKDAIMGRFNYMV